MSWSALNGHVRDPPILDAASGCQPAAAGENGEGGDRGGGLGVGAGEQGVSRRRRRGWI